jgi:hypothetical protein
VILIGGAARSEAVRRIAPEIFGVPVTVPKPAEYVALGAARRTVACPGLGRNCPRGRAPASARIPPSPPAVRARYAPSATPPRVGAEPASDHGVRRIATKTTHDHGTLGARPGAGGAGGEIWEHHDASRKDRSEHGLRSSREDASRLASGRSAGGVDVFGAPCGVHARERAVYGWPNSAPTE